MEWVSGLESHNFVPASLLELCLELLRLQPVVQVVLVNVLLFKFELAADLDVFDEVSDVVPLRVVLVAALSDLVFPLFVRGEDVVDVDVPLGFVVEVLHFHDA